MGSRVIALFSSDARELYKADIYRALTLPSGYVLHFRYLRKYIQSELLTRITSLRDSKGIIYFVSGNEVSTPIEQRKPESHSIRHVNIKDIEEDPHIDTIHFYLELGEFADAPPHPETVNENLPPHVFVSEIAVSEGPNKRWVDRVNRISQHFPRLMFFHIDCVTAGNRVLRPVYNCSVKSSEYRLHESLRYQCKITFYNPDLSETGLAAETVNNSAVALIVPSNHRLAAQRDTVTFELLTHGLSQKQQVCFTYLYGRLGESGAQFNPQAWRVELKWEVSRGLRKAVAFGLASAAAALGVALARMATDDLTSLNTGLANILIGAVSLLLIGAAAGYLFEFFNKK